MDRRQALRCGVGLGLGLGAVAVFGAAGCSVSDPRIEDPTPSSADPTPTGQSSAPPNDPSQPPDPDPTPTFAGAAEAADSERRLAGLASALLTGPFRKELGVRAPLLAAVRDAHLAHATALLGVQPTSRPTDHPASAVPPHKSAKSLAVALDRLVVAERAEAARTRLSAVNTTGLSSLLWASMSIAANTYAAAVETGVATSVRKPKPARTLPLLSDVDSMQQLVRQLHAVNYGYSLAIGQLADGHRRNVAIRALRDRRVLRDSLVTTLQSRKAEIPIAEPAYVPTVYPRSNATASRLVQDLESRLAPFVALWLAAVPSVPERTRAFTTLSGTIGNARFWGAPLRTWPGWST